MILVQLKINDEENDTWDILESVLMPFAPCAGCDIKIWIDKDYHFIKIESIDYIFNADNTFSHIEAYLGSF